MASFELFAQGRPDEANLTERFGVRPPATYVQFAQWCFDRANGIVDHANSIYWSCLHLESNDVDNTGYASPFELYSIGDDDGNQVGWVVLAPEIPADDYPWVWYLHDGDSIWVLAQNSQDFFRRALSYTLVTYPESSLLVTEAAAHLNVAISKELGSAVGSFGAPLYFKTGHPAPTLEITVPDGWRYVPAEPKENGLGVLAPSDAFAPGPHLVDRSADPLDLAADLGDNDRPASALWHLLTPNARHLTPMDQYGYWIKYVKQAYINLGREMMARRVQQYCE